MSSGRVQVRVNGLLMGSLFISMMLNWFFGKHTCANYAVTWYGAASITLPVAFLACASIYGTMPRDHTRRLLHRTQLVRPRHRSLLRMHCMPPDAPHALCTASAAHAAHALLRAACCAAASL
jgi:hypothetical protein